jgi:hypothetical protein
LSRDPRERLDLRTLPQFGKAAVAGELADQSADAQDNTPRQSERAHNIQRLLPDAKVTLRF